MLTPPTTLPGCVPLSQALMVETRLPSPKLLAVENSVTILIEDVDQNRTLVSVWEAIPGSASQRIL